MQNPSINVSRKINNFTFYLTSFSRALIQELEITRVASETAQIGRNENVVPAAPAKLYQQPTGFSEKDNGYNCNPQYLQVC